MNTKFIESHINAFSDYTIRQRGLSLLRSNKVKFVKKLEDERYSFRVDGQVKSFYEVIIDHPYSPKIESSCECAYAINGQMCKHQIAALNYLKEEMPMESLNTAVVTDRDKMKGYRYSNEDLNVKNFSPITNELLDSIKSTELEDVQDYDISLKKHTDKKLVYELREKPSSFSYKTNYYLVQISSVNNKTIGLKCTCSKLVKKDKVCEHAYALFKYLMNNSEDNNLDYIGTKGVELLNKKAAQLTNVSVEILNEYYDVSIEDGLIKVDKKEGNQGLISGSDWNSGLGLLIKDSINESSAVEKLLPAPISSDNLGFSIAFQLHFWDYIELYPLTAKTNKNNSALTSNFKVYDASVDESFPYEYSKEYPELFKVLDVFRYNYELLEKKEINNNDVYIMLKQVFTLSKDLDYPVYECSKPYVKKASRRDLNIINLSDDRVKVKFKLSKENLVYILKVYIQIGENEILMDNDTFKSLYVNRFIIKLDNKLHLFKNLKHQKVLESFYSFVQIMVPVSDYKKLETNFLRPLIDNFDVDLSEFKEINYIEDYQRPIAKEIYLKESKGRILFVPKVLYKNGAQFDLLTDNCIYSTDKEIIRMDRDADYEDNYLNFLEGLHPDFIEQRDFGVYYLGIKQMTTSYWFLDAFEKMRDHGIKIFGLNDIKGFKYSTHRANVNTVLKSEEDWFDVDLQVSFGDYTLSIEQLRKMALNNDRYVELGDGSVGVLPKEWLDKIKKMFRYGDASAKNELKISKIKLSLIDELAEDINQAEIIEELAVKRRKLLSFSEISKVEVPAQVNANLRSYQKEGLNWLNFLDDNKWGGILADDMGLGKTLQILAFLQLQINNEPDATHLIVLPTTLVFNWEKEIKKFTKDIKPLFHVGVKRIDSIKKFERYNLVITTYGVLLNDIEFIKEFRFKYAILDESQMIKNPSSKRYKAAILINAQNKIAMTGTPIENNTFDLYAQMNFVNPGFLGSPSTFKEDYSLPIDRDRNEQRAKDLHRLINPFILRRTKDQVATELPPKIEDVLYCEMEHEQMKVYEAFRNKYRDFLMGKIQEDGLNKSKMYVLEGLIKLRQICDSPRLLAEPEVYTDESIKIKTLISHIEEKTNNHKILVFSQFVKMLDLVREKLKSKNISFEYLDGKCSSKQREESVDNFQNNEEVRVFLISLKAGGTGLNLTAADYIYLLDPWWNPAVENQAIDRAYRIGQDKKVIAYRMISKDTIEEKIMKIQSKKKKLASDIIQTDESILKELTQADILDLFK